MRLYRIVAVVLKTGKRVTLCHGPLTHPEACTVLSKLTRHPWRMELLEEVEP